MVKYVAVCRDGHVHSFKCNNMMAALHYFVEYVGISINDIVSIKEG